MGTCIQNVFNSSSGRNKERGKFITCRKKTITKLDITADLGHAPTCVKMISEKGSLQIADARFSAVGGHAIEAVHPRKGWTRNPSRLVLSVRNSVFERWDGWAVDFDSTKGSLSLSENTFGRNSDGSPDGHVRAYGQYGTIHENDYRGKSPVVEAAGRGITVSEPQMFDDPTDEDNSATIEITPSIVVLPEPNKPSPIPNLIMASDHGAERCSNSFEGGDDCRRSLDSAPGIQRALNRAGEQGGGVVLLDIGRRFYPLRTPLVVPDNVELRGPAGSAVHSGSFTTWLLVFHNDGPAITLGENAGVRGFVVFYPEQDWRPDRITQYNPTIQSDGSNCYAIDVCFANAANPIDFATNPDNGGHYVDSVGYANLFGTGLQLGRSGNSPIFLKNVQANMGYWKAVNPDADPLMSVPDIDPRYQTPSKLIYNHYSKDETRGGEFSLLFGRVGVRVGNAHVEAHHVFQHGPEVGFLVEADESGDLDASGWTKPTLVDVNHGGEVGVHQIAVMSDSTVSLGNWKLRCAMSGAGKVVSDCIKVDSSDAVVDFSNLIIHGKPTGSVLRVDGGEVTVKQVFYHQAPKEVPFASAGEPGGNLIIDQGILRQNWMLKQRSTKACVAERGTITIDKPSKEIGNFFYVDSAQKTIFAKGPHSVDECKKHRKDRKESTDKEFV